MAEGLEPPTTKKEDWKSNILSDSSSSSGTTVHIVWRQLFLQDITIADATRLPKIVAWEENVGAVQEGLSYIDITTDVYDNETFLSLSLIPISRRPKISVRYEQSA